MIISKFKSNISDKSGGMCSIQHEYGKPYIAKFIEENWFWYRIDQK